MALSHSLIDRLSTHLGTDVRIERDVPIGGGSINDAYRLDTNKGPFFVKVNPGSRQGNPADRSPSMFEAEADGLQRLRGTNTLRIPEVIAFGEDQDDSYLLLEHIEGGVKNTGFWEDFGKGLARLHGHTNATFGLACDNYIGSLKQVNTPCAKWDAFFIQCRLEPQVKMARERQRIGMGDVLRFERLYAELPSLFPPEPPALLHGDLWSGNFLCDANGKPVLIDPAVYFGHREMDIAMTKLFGGFEPAFYRAYNEERPPAAGWEERVDLCNLYPLLVHVNLFGGAYAQQVAAILKRYT